MPLENVYVFLSAPQLQAVVAGLKELPYRIAAPVLDDVERQVKDAIQRAEGPKQGEPSGAVNG